MGVAEQGSRTRDTQVSRSLTLLCYGLKAPPARASWPGECIHEAPGGPFELLERRRESAPATRWAVVLSVVACDKPGWSWLDRLDCDSGQSFRACKFAEVLGSGSEGCCIYVGVNASKLQTGAPH